MQHDQMPPVVKISANGGSILFDICISIIMSDQMHFDAVETLGQLTPLCCTTFVAADQIGGFVQADSPFGEELL